MLNLHNFTRGARINNPSRALQVLSDDDIRRAAPSVFADGAHHSRSERYTYIPTAAVLAALRKEDFLPVKASQSRCRLADKSDFTKHMLRFRRGGMSHQAVGDVVPEIVLVNSHDGTSAYKLYAALFRLECSNGLVVCAGNIGEEISVPHKGNVEQRVIEGSFQVIDEAALTGSRVKVWQDIDLDEREQEAFAHSALQLRYDTEDKAAPITEKQALAVRRSGDTGNDLWTTFNRVQEALVRGGNRYMGVNGRRGRTREVTGIDQNIKLNRALWTLAETMKKLKAA